MADVTDRAEEMAPELSDKCQPGVAYRDLPEPMPFGKILGASVIILATAFGSGELILWESAAKMAGEGDIPVRASRGV
jgi:hypothetical protein